MGLPANHYKVGNRIYTLMDVDGIDYIVKFTHNIDTDVLGPECGRWPKSDFLAHVTTFDQNTEIEYDAIKIALGI